jgi:hypothetical protein
MKLSDVVAHAGLSLYAELALVLFLIVFAAVLIRLYLPGQSAELEAQRMLPLEPETPAKPREGAAR